MRDYTQIALVYCRAKHIYKRDIVDYWQEEIHFVWIFCLYAETKEAASAQFS